VRALMDLTPAEALVRDEEGERRVAVDLITPGAIIVVKPGEKLPLDGEVVAGASSVNQAPVTGESLPADKVPGDEVFAGSINGRGALEVRVTKLRRDTTLARVIHLVEQAQAQRAPAQTFVERFARVYTPAVIALAVTLAVVPPLFAGGVWETWIYRALVLLVVSCPCALVISTPVSIVAALAAAARMGVLFKGGAHLERAGRVRCVAFDKTGTLTRGEPNVTDVVPFAGYDEITVLRLAASVEAGSEHPLGEAIVRGAKHRNLVMGKVEGFEAIAGHGIRGRIDGMPVLLGNRRHLKKEGIDPAPADKTMVSLESEGKTAMLVAANGVLAGVIAVADTLKPEAKETIAELMTEGIEVVMLTGDNRRTAEAIGRELGITHVIAEVLPSDKARVIQDLQKNGKVVAMVGDGVNDAPALATAEIGIAIGSGSDVAKETGGIILVRDDVRDVVTAIRLSRATMRKIKQNLFWAFIYNALGIPIAAFGLLNPIIAAAAMAFSSLSVIVNSALLKRIRLAA